VSDVTQALVVEDLPSSREWLVEALNAAFPGITVRACATLAEAARLLDPPPQVALIDLALPDGSGVSLIQRLQREHPQCLCVVATVFDDDAHLFPALAAGAQGYVLKDQSRDVLAQMLCGIAAGQPPLSPSIARRLLRHFRATPRPPDEEEPLTARENEVLRLMAKGYTVQEAAQMLELSRHTVASYLKDVYRKLRVGSRAEATLEAARRGLIAPP
jgi:DNA-binding NarL/FixJ family response regulator